MCRLLDKDNDPLIPSLIGDLVTSLNLSLTYILVNIFDWNRQQNIEQEEILL